MLQAISLEFLVSLGKFNLEPVLPRCHKFSTEICFLYAVLLSLRYVGIVSKVYPTQFLADQKSSACSDDPTQHGILQTKDPNERIVRRRSRSVV